MRKRIEDKQVGQGAHIVSAGECLSSIAYEHGHHWKTILTAVENAELRSVRTNHHVLLPGDRLTIPPIRPKEENAGTDERHTYVLRGVPEIFRLRLLDEADEPRANLHYTLVIDGRISEGTTDAEGELKHSIPPNARRATIVIDSGEEQEEIELRLGDLNPKDTITGVQARLRNLGFDCGNVDGVLGPKTRKALHRFQRRSRLEPTGEPDDATINALEGLHGS